MKKNSTTGFKFVNLPVHSLLKPVVLMTASRTKENDQLIFNFNSVISILCFIVWPLSGLIVTDWTKVPKFVNT